LGNRSETNTGVYTAASYNVWDRDSNNLWKGGAPREEVDSRVVLNAVKLRKERKITLRKRRNKMNRNVLEGKWLQLRGAVREKWGDLTDDDLDQIAGKRDKLAGILQERYGYTQIEADREIDDFLTNWEDND
jgi:uncharacterized protein YjbJ (UPF0337 family)